MRGSSTPPTGMPAVLAGFAAALVGRPVRDWSPAAAPPQDAASGHRLSADIVLWRLPVGGVRVRERHRALEDAVAATSDAARFPMMMADTRISEWLTCTAWLIRHPEGTLLVDTGEAPDFGTRDYFAGVDAVTRRLYPRIIDARTSPDRGLVAALATAGLRLADVDRCVLTHLHSDHVGNAALLARRTRILVGRGETEGTPGTGRLPGKLPADGDRVTLIDPPPLGDGAARWPLTARGDIYAVATPGHTRGTSASSSIWARTG